jgi:hypothetical protein
MAGTYDSEEQRFIDRIKCIAFCEARDSPDLNAAEHIGSIIKNEVEKKMLSETERSRYLEETLKMHVSDVLTNMETDTDLFETLLCSYPSRLRAVKSANGRHTDY